MVLQEFQIYQEPFGFYTKKLKIEDTKNPEIKFLSSLHLLTH